MTPSTITVFGRSFPASPRTTKLFIFVWMPLLLCFALFNGYLLADAVAQATGVSLVWVLAAIFAITFTLTLTVDGGQKALGLLKKPWQRTAFGALLIGHGLYFYARTEQPIYVYCLAAFAVFTLVSKLGAHVAKVKKEAQAEGERLAKIAVANGFVRPGRAQSVDDIDFKDVAR